MRTEQLREVCAGWDLPDSVADELCSVALPCVLAVHSEAAAGQDQKSGDSQFGGTPCLSAAEQWPKARDQRPLQFVIQIDVAQLPPGPWPINARPGLLQFFYDDRNGEAGKDSLLRLITVAHSGCSPAEAAPVLLHSRLQLTAALSLPWRLPHRLRHLEEVVGDYTALKYDLRSSFTGGQRAHQLFGYPAAELPQALVDKSFILQVNHVSDRLLVFGDWNQDRISNLEVYYDLT